MPGQQYVYDETVASRYEKAVPIQDGEVEFYLELARVAAAQGLDTLEVACGGGRIAIPLAREGIRITGIDSSPAMLDVARRNSAGLDNARWLEADMRDFDLGEQFGLAFIAIGTFQLMLTVEDQLACLRAVRRHLAPGGRLAFEVEHPNLMRIAEWLTTRRGTFARADRDYADEGIESRAWDNFEYHPSEQRYVSIRVREEIDGAGLVMRREFGQPMTVRYFHRYEVEHLLARAGFTVEALYGDLRKNALRGTSPDMVWVARPDGAATMPEA